MYTVKTLIRIPTSSRAALWRICCKYCNKVLYTSTFHKEIDSLSEEISQWNSISFQRDRFFEHAEECPNFRRNPQTYPRTIFLD
jgi:hypothetical protein